MTLLRRIRTPLAAAAALLLGTAWAGPPRATVTVLPALGVQSQANALNDLGQVVGTGDGQAFIWDAVDGLVMLPGGAVTANGINNAGQVVGHTLAGNFQVAFRYSAATGMSLLHATNVHSFANGINDAGVAAGSGQNSGGRTRAWRWTPGQAGQELLAGGDFANGHAINRHGAVVGRGLDGNGQSRAAIWDANGTTLLGTLGGNYSNARAVNSNGDVAGGSTPASDREQAFVWTAAQGMVGLGTLGGVESSAYGLSDAGQAVGFAHDANQSARAFLWTRQGGMRNLDGAFGTSAFRLTQANAINSFSQVVGYGQGAATSNRSRGFLLTLHPDWTGGDGRWDDARWDFGGTGVAPSRIGAMHDVVIDPGVSATVQGATLAQVRTLAVGGTAGRIVTLDLAGGTLDTSAGAVVRSGGVLRGSGRVDGQVQVLDGGRLALAGGQSLQVSGGLAVTGTLDLQARSGAAVLEVGGPLALQGSAHALNADIRAGSVRVDGRLNLSGLSTVAGDVEVTKAGRIAVSGTAAEALIWDALHNDGTVTVTAGSAASFFGQVRGAGGFDGAGAKHFAGGYAPGNSPARINLEGDISFSGGLLEMELGGMAPGTQHDQLVFNAGRVTLAGAALHIRWWGDHAGAAGQAYDLFDWNGVHAPLAGVFSSVVLPTLAPGLAWDLATLYGDGRVRVVAVPEPGTWALLAAGLLGSAWRVRRRRPDLIAG